MQSGRSAMSLVLALLSVVAAAAVVAVKATPSSKDFRFDTSIEEFSNTRTCWTGEVCKTEFQSTFRCMCPRWYWCKSPGKYYHAYCSISAFGYIWIQPNGLQPEDARLD
ncbi:uncharacterized protein LOC143026668 [Oratosquilla oratoria]|uniref:uncharacterized protein LOC143026668 n=1 Tax=Oratosquilla oratoria TaxID=337810 RepID=UPI003F75A0EF